MEVLYPRCAGLDVHSRCVNACARIAAGRKVTTEHREFATTTAGLLELAAWLTEAGCTHVAMEATGVYWKPVWHVLEDEASFTLVLANAQHIRNVPGRKSDRKDAAWIADLLAHGLIDALTAAVQQVEQQADEVLRPFREAAERLATMPGVSETVARVIIAEVGVDMTQFPSAGHLVSWAGLHVSQTRVWDMRAQAPSSRLLRVSYTMSDSMSRIRREEREWLGEPF